MAKIFCNNQMQNKGFHGYIEVCVAQHISTTTT